ncbi:MAG: cysteine-rich CWC family protein [Rhodoferax sp.]|nr:cysteine-rich CWC family protein [Rhodoferax sp.]
MNASPPSPATHLCPLCGQPNQCAMAAPNGATTQQPCWCTQEKFSADLLEQIAPEARGLACVCVACVRSAQR